MKRHILSSVSEVKNQKKVSRVYYDMRTQVSYIDEDFKKKINQIRGGRSVETRVIENSDEDCFNLEERTRKTFTVENGDTDELSIYQLDDRTNLSKTIESSDTDEFYLSRSVETSTIEVSDTDEFMLN